MTKNQTRPKLVFGVESIRRLSGAELAQAGGGSGQDIKEVAYRPGRTK